MSGIIKSITICFITLILFLSIFLASVPTTLAGPLDKVYECQYALEVDYDIAAAEAPFLPLDMTIDIPLTLNLRAIGIYAEEMMPYYGSSSTLVDLYINHTSTWCTATISPAFLMVPADDEWVPSNTTLHVKIDENSRAFVDGNVQIRIEVGGLGAILSRTFNVDIPFRPGYLPQLKVYTEVTNQLIEPSDTANFDIEIENLGNAKTNVTCRVLNMPKDWVISIDSNAIIGSRTLGENSKKTISLVIRPPYGFGYHQDREVVQVSIVPLYYDDDTLIGQEYLLSFIVQSRGFSTPGFEGIFVIFALIGMVFFIKRQHKTRGSCKSIDKRGKA